MSKKGTPQEIKEYNRQKQAYRRAKKKELSLTWEEYLKSLTQENAKPELVKPDKECQTSEMSNLSNSNLSNFVKSVNVKPNMVNLDCPKLAQLIREWQTGTNYSCTFNCSLNKYCSNCWYFIKGEFIDYKEETCLK